MSDSNVRKRESMKISRSALICAAVALLTIPALGAFDLSKYRNFSLGSSLAAVSKQAQVSPDQIKTIHKSPAMIQQFTVWPIESSDAPERSEDVQQMELSFCNGQLYNVTATYKTSATQGLTNDDMIRAISARYGVATRPDATSGPPPQASFGTADLQLASWQDAQDSVALFRSPLSDSFKLVVLSKAVQAQADAATAEALVQERDDAPQRETARIKKEADDLQALRDANLKAFRP